MDQVNGQVVCSEIRKSDSAVIRGGIVQTPIPLFKAPAGFRLPVTDGWWVFNPIHIWFKIFSLVVTLLIIYFIVAVYPGGVERISDSVGKDTIRNLIIGFISFILLFPMALTIIGIPLALFLAAAARFLSYAGVTLFVGRRFLQAVNRPGKSIYLQVFMGIVLIGLVEFVPFLGGLIGLVLFWLSMGSMLDTKFGTGRPWFNKA